MTTPIFDVIRGPETDNGLKPVKIKAPDWVSIMVEREGKLLIEKQFRYGANDCVEEFPCGMNDDDNLSSDTSSTAFEWLNEQCKEGDAMSWRFEIEDLTEL